MRTRSLALLSSALLALPALAFMACGGSTSSGVDAGGGTDGGGSDMTVAPETGSNDSGGGMDAFDSGGGNDTGTPDTGPGACNAPGMTRMQCRMCCGMQDRDGQAALFMDLFQCACAPDICGPPGDAGASDAGAPEAGADGGVGPGDCTATCTTGAPPAGRCLRCGLASLRPDGGACHSIVTPECAMDPACLAYVQCTQSCP
jgi:hypothetical protein